MLVSMLILLKVYQRLKRVGGNKNQKQKAG
jgi:hypothetical protein